MGLLNTETLKGYCNYFLLTVSIQKSEDSWNKVCQHLRKYINNSVENMQTDIRV